MRRIFNESQIDSLSDYFKMIGSSFGSGSGYGASGYGGYGSNCFFNCMVYLDSLYNSEDEEEHLTCEDYHDLFHDGSFWSFGSDANNTKYGPMNYIVDENTQKEVVNHHSHDFINMFFETKESEWQEDAEAIEGLLKKQKGENKGKVLAVIWHPTGECHAVILDQEAGNDFTYYDPTTKEYKKVSKDDVLYATKITGMKNNTSDE